MNEIRQRILKWIDADERSLVQFFSEFVRCKSPNPPGDTRAAMQHVQALFQANDLPFREVNACDDWPNLISSFTEARIPIGTDIDALVHLVREIVGRRSEAEITALSISAPDYCDPTDDLAVVLQDTVESLGRPRPAMFVSSALSDCKYWRDRGIPAFW